MKDSSENLPNPQERARAREKKQENQEFGLRQRLRSYSACITL